MLTCRSFRGINQCRWWISWNDWSRLELRNNIIIREFNPFLLKGGTWILFIDLLWCTPFFRLISDLLYFQLVCYELKRWNGLILNNMRSDKGWIFLVFLQSILIFAFILFRTFDFILVISILRLYYIKIYMREGIFFYFLVI